MPKILETLKEKSPMDHMNTSLTLTTQPFCNIMVGELYEVSFLPWPMKLGCFFLTANEAKIILFVIDKAEHFETSLWDPHDEAG